MAILLQVVKYMSLIHLDRIYKVSVIRFNYMTNYHSSCSGLFLVVNYFAGTKVLSDF